MMSTGTDMWTLRRDFEVTFADDSYTEVVAGLHWISGNAEPYWSVTGQIWERHGTWSGRRRAEKLLDPDMGGCIHGHILARFPELAPVIAVHLASESGVPMHAFENGWYFYSGQAREYEQQHIPHANPEGLSDLARAARALHIDQSLLPEGMTVAEFRVFVESLSPVWARQAAAARAVLESLPPTTIGDRL
ncbi:hypothetical protein PBI_MEGABEAR_90 [Mycobacterium phage Megabear]|nr:hypothetical protein PBI_MEGABEAR_90 [Mycobacterium phage Megabear]QBP31208.1 hypothetical protein SEA_ARGIE_93 [Mycobacterium phage Argie]